ncbi:MAG TPA: adenine deaminase [Cyclobacteriaceae bacterium]|nr:adenine deaminase [Cyclobacteriaceae bacterium]
MKIAGQLVDIPNRRTFPAELVIADGRIIAIRELPDAPAQYILPGFIDAHVHVESSMIVPAEFARMAVVHGTVATISDPHEIGNVLGVAGVNYMIENGKKVPFKFCFGAPSCVPATTFETAGAEIGVDDVDQLLQRPEIKYLAEMMNWPGVLHGDPIVKAKIALAHKYHKIVDGHAPGLRGEMAARYVAAGISTDHECFTREEALDKLNCGMKILIREGSAARNFDALVDLIHEHSSEMMFCSDDKHPDSLEAGHINLLARRAVAKGIDVFKVLQVACLNAISHYNLEVGQLRPGDPADCIIVNDLKQFEVLQTYVNGILVAHHGQTRIARTRHDVINRFSTLPKLARDFEIAGGGKPVRVMVPHDGQLITDERLVDPKVVNGKVVADPARDILKIAVVNRYHDAKPAVALITNFGLKQGAIASSVGHDSHNIIAVGADDDAIAAVVNEIIKHQGGVAATDGTNLQILPLPVAGIMSDQDGYIISKQYQAIDQFAKALGSKLGAPFMTLSFMALLVIPALKLSDKGLFDGATFKFVPLETT